MNAATFGFPPHWKFSDIHGWHDPVTLGRPKEIRGFIEGQVKELGSFFVNQNVPFNQTCASCGLTSDPLGHICPSIFPLMVKDPAPMNEVHLSCSQCPVSCGTNKRLCFCNCHLRFSKVNYSKFRPKGEPMKAAAEIEAELIKDEERLDSLEERIKILELEGQAQIEMFCKFVSEHGKIENKVKKAPLFPRSARTAREQRAVKTKSSRTFWIVVASLVALNLGVFGFILF